MKKNVLTTPKDKLLNLAVGTGIPLGTAASGIPEAARVSAAAAAVPAWAALHWQPGSAAAYILSAAVKV